MRRKLVHRAFYNLHHPSNGKHKINDQPDVPSLFYFLDEYIKQEQSNRLDTSKRVIDVIHHF
jgi:hypothetical protein